MVEGCAQGTTKVISSWVATTRGSSGVQQSMRRQMKDNEEEEDRCKTGSVES
jgi:hypothetical protein